MVEIILIIDWILINIQTYILLKRAKRVSEVNARFLLDSMPGRQMKIDADFNDGKITHEKAMQQRRKLRDLKIYYEALDETVSKIKAIYLVITFLSIVFGVILKILCKNTFYFKFAIGAFILIDIAIGLSVVIIGKKCINCEKYFKKKWKDV